MTDNLDPKTVKLFDRRVVRRFVKRGLVTHADVKAFVEGLPDVADKAVTFETPAPNEESSSVEVADGSGASEAVAPANDAPAANGGFDPENA